jgi:carbon monoxide dehydrogenase subunit G
MSITIAESFSVNAPVERVWRFLTTPQEVVQSIQGAELTEVLGEREYAGRVNVRVGPISAAYAGKATLATVDETTKRMRLIGQGRESGGAGSAKLVLDGSVTPNATGGSDVRIDATIDVAGKVMQFGRGLVETVSQQLFQQFVEDARARLEVVDADTTGELRTDVGEQSPAGPPPKRELRILALLWKAFVDRLRRLIR